MGRGSTLCPTHDCVKEIIVRLLLSVNSPMENDCILVLFHAAVSL